MTLVKICGLKDAEAAEVALDNGAAMLGFILVPGRARTVDLKVARDIVQLCKQRQKMSSKRLYDLLDKDNWTQSAYKLIQENGPYAVGVFRNQSVAEINECVATLGLDFVQLHGSEPRDEYIAQIPVPVITRFVPEDKQLHEVNKQSQVLTLFDSEAGGGGQKLDWEELSQWSTQSGASFVLAGGLTPDNVHEAVRIAGVVGVDVSGGVETNGVKDHAKIRAFLRNAHGV